MSQPCVLCGCWVRCATTTLQLLVVLFIVEFAHASLHGQDKMLYAMLSAYGLVREFANLLWWFRCAFHTASCDQLLLPSV